MRTTAQQLADLQGRVLRAVTHRGLIERNDIAAALGLAVSTVGRALDALEHQGRLIRYRPAKTGNQAMQYREPERFALGRVWKRAGARGPRYVH